jgi:hypothetical protein
VPESRQASRGPDGLDNHGLLEPDLMRGEMQHDDAAGAHPGVPAHRAFPVRWGEMPLPGVHLRGEPGVRPPCVRDRQQNIAAVQPGVEHRQRKTGPDEQGTEIAFGARPDTVSDLG